MYNDIDCVAALKKPTAEADLEQSRPCDTATLAARIKALLERHGPTLNEAGIRKEVRQLEDWLESECDGPAPDRIISKGGLAWLKQLRDRLKLSAEEAQRLEGEGGAPRSKEQLEQTEDMLRTVRRIDKIISNSTVTESH